MNKFKIENDVLVVVATPQEYNLALETFNVNKNRILITGVGGTNVIKALKNIPLTTKILNFGYAGSNSIPVGTIVKIKSSQIYHPNCEYVEDIYLLDGDIPCYTSSDFVLQTDIKEPVVFDMELAYICAMGFNVSSIKVVSDNLNYKDYENNIEI